ncbi:MAG: tRNA 4-thiouridine(8) synthase ThiI [Ruminococcaceae bacterium]|nr:tRNA 4-thiouridine(8) synthase ThiI [Oscillospiraceae bacterium]
MTRTILMKYGELILKGANKRSFEKLLCDRIKARMTRVLGAQGFEFECMQSTLYVTPKDDSMVEEAYEDLKRIFGIVSLCISYRAEKNMEDILRVSLENIPKHIKNCRSFKVDARRSDKQFPLTSPQIMAEVGGELSELCPEVKVDVVHPEIVVRVEIREKYAYIHAGNDHGAGGMPYLSNGRGLLLLSGGIDSPVAGYMMAKRGVEIEAVHFESFPYTSERAKEKVIALAKCLCKYTDKIRIHFVSLTEIQEAIRDNCEEDYFTLILRRFMMPIAQRVAEKCNAQALITGESIGQVASQTMSAIAVTDCTATIPVFRPCIGMDKEEIVEIARKIDTFETSILPYEDCCTVFTPRHPRTKPQLEKVIRAEKNLDREALIEKALDTMTDMVVEL